MLLMSEKYKRERDQKKGASNAVFISNVILLINLENLAKSRVQHGWFLAGLNHMCASHACDLNRV